MSKDREAFYRICQRCTSNPFDEEYYTITDDMPEEVEIVEQALIKAEIEHKALEIINDKEVNMYMLKWYFKYSSYEQYVKDFNNPDYDDPTLGEELLTEEEYNLLKEIF